MIGSLIGSLASSATSSFMAIGMGLAAKDEIASGASKRRAAMHRALVEKELARREETTQRVGTGLGRVAGGGLDATVGAGGTAAQVRIGEAIAESRDIAQLRANFAVGITELNVRESAAQSQATAGILTGVFGGASKGISAFGSFKASGG